MSKSSGLICAIDVGGQKDPSTIAVVQLDKKARLWVLALEQIPLGLSFEQQVPVIVHYLEQISPALIAIDATGTGRGLSELLTNPERVGKEIARKVRPVIWTSGQKENLKDAKQWTIPKHKAVTSAAIAMIDLQFAEGVNPQNKAEFFSQIQKFQAKQNATSVTYGSDSVHDDWVMSFALASFVAGKKGGRSGSIGSPVKAMFATDTAVQDVREQRPEGWGKRRGLTGIYSVDIASARAFQQPQNGDGSWNITGRGWPDR